MKKIRGLFRLLFGRTTVVILLLLIQIAILLSVFNWLSGYITYVYWIFMLFSSSVLIAILNTEDNPVFKTVWIIPVLLIPVFGSLFYLYIHLELGTRLIKKRMKSILDDTGRYLVQDDNVYKNLVKDSRGEATLERYISRFGGYPTYDNTSVTYFPLGENMFEELKIKLESAENFIFLEYFIIENGEMWDSILEILKRKAASGVDVRVMYDGMCMLLLLPTDYPKRLSRCNIKCKPYAPIHPVLSSYQNNRDHRKITVIDGKYAFTGGVNLADEYINKKVVYGHWKDTAVMLQGDAVKSFTMMFLQMWNLTERLHDNYDSFLPDFTDSMSYPNTGGYVMPYSDSPFDNERVGETVYLDILNQADKYVHIMTPYLILDYEMQKALEYSAKRGVETSIILPHIPDKKYAFALARAHYKQLIKAGVNIYEYTPGFVHAKVFVSDDEKASVGSINLDFRSLYLHFECAAYIYRNNVIYDIEKDYQETLLKCHKVSLDDCAKFSIIERIMGRILKIFAPLM